MKRRVAFALLLLLTLGGRHRYEVPPTATLAIPIDGDGVFREVILEYQLGIGFWVPVVLPRALYEGDCVAVYDDYGIRTRVCWAEDPTSCSPRAVRGVTATCNQTQDWR